MEKLQRLRNLMVMAVADGRISDEEMRILRDRCRKWNISQEEFQQSLQYAESELGTLQLSDDPEHRREIMAEFVELMGADGDYADVEMTLFAIAASQLGIPDDELNRIIDQVLDGDDLIL